MRYRVVIALTEYYTAEVEADDRDSAEDIADELFENGEMELTSSSSQTDITEMGG